MIIYFMVPIEHDKPKGQNRCATYVRIMQQPPRIGETVEFQLKPGLEHYIVQNVIYSIPLLKSENTLQLHEMPATIVDSVIVMLKHTKITTRKKRDISLN